MEIARLVRKLNAHHLQYAAGFYLSTGGRAFIAKSIAGKLHVSRDFKTFEPVTPDCEFHDHNGRFLASQTR